MTAQAGRHCPLCRLGLYTASSQPATLQHQQPAAAQANGTCSRSAAAALAWAWSKSRQALPSCARVSSMVATASGSSGCALQERQLWSASKSLASLPAALHAKYKHTPISDGMMPCSMACTRALYVLLVCHRCQAGSAGCPAARHWAAAPAGPAAHARSACPA